MLKRRKPAKASPIDERRRALQERERELKRREQGLKRVIEEAPRLREEAERRERETLVVRGKHGRGRAWGPELLDHRFNVNAPIASARSTKIERQRQKLHFWALVILLAAAVIVLIQFLPS
jgi:hypothetical protein